MNVRPHVARRPREFPRSTAATRHPGYAKSQRPENGSRKRSAGVRYRRDAQDALHRLGQGRLGLHLRGRRLQPGAATGLVGEQGGGAQKISIGRPLPGPLADAEMDLRDEDAVDLVEPGLINSGRRRRVRTSSPCAWLDVRYGARMVGRSRILLGGRRRGRPTLRPRLGHAQDRRWPRRTYLLPQWRRFRLRLRTMVGCSTACSALRVLSGAIAELLETAPS